VNQAIIVFAGVVRGPMEHDDKVSAALLAPGLGSAAAPVRAARFEGTGAHGRDAVTDVLSAAPSGGGVAHGASGAVREEPEEDEPEEPKSGRGKTPKKHANNVRRIRIERMMSKAELARRANLSVLTIDRVERGYGCRMDTKRKILEALGLSLADRVRVFGEEE
jgi:DNA-binding XRE family transcriptional regulator